MSKQTENGSLELEVTDFGPIVEARVDLRPLTVFVGPSNTGKSYLAILIYALHRVFGGDPRFRGRGLIRTGLPFRLDNRKLSKASVDSLVEMATTLSDDSIVRGRGSIVLPSPAADALRSGLDGLGDALIRRNRAMLRSWRFSRTAP